MKERPLFNAILEQNLPALNQLLAGNTNLNVRDSQGNTPLTLAVEQKCMKSVKSLLMKNIDPNLANQKGQPPLLLACLEGDPDMVTLLLKGDGINLNYLAPDGSCCLTTAILLNNPAIVEILLEGGADPNLANTQEQTPLMLACEQGHEEIVKLLVKYQAKVNVRDHHGNTPFNLAATGNHIAIAMALGFSEEILDSAHEMALACESGDMTTLSVLLQYVTSVDINAALNEHGQTALMIAVENGHLSVARQLISQGADVNEADRWGSTPLHFAAGNMYDQTAFIKLLVEAGGNINAMTERHYTPLHKAILSQYATAQCLQTLLESGGDINAANEKSQLPLLLAAEKGRIDLMDVLLQSSGIDLNATNAEGRTALMLAAMSGHQEIIEILLSRRVDVDAKDFSGRTALDYATEYREKEIARIIKGHRPLI